FLVIADFLTRKGIAVLRADDRGIGKSTGDFGKATSLDFTDDALGGVAYLKTRKEIDPKRIGLAGHSEGGLIAPIAPTKSSDVAFIILLAGPGYQGTEILHQQGRLIAKASGASDRAIEWTIRLQRRLFPLAGEGLDAKAFDQRIRESLKEELKNLSPDDR